MDALEVPLHSQGGSRPSQGRVFLSRHLPQAGVQVIQLLMESSAELLQEGGVQGSKGTLCVEEVEALLEHLVEHLVEHRDGLDLLELVTLCHLLGETEAFSVLPTGVRGESVLLGKEPEVLAANQHVVLRQITGQRSSRAVADQHQGRQYREHQIHGEDEAAAGLAEMASGGTLEVGCLMMIFLSKA